MSYQYKSNDPVMDQQVGSEQHPYDQNKDILMHDVGSVMCGLAQAIRERRFADKNESYSAKLSELGLQEVARSMSDAVCCLAMDVSSNNIDRDAVIQNAVDVIYLLVLCLENLGVPITEVMYFISERIEKSGFDIVEISQKYNPSKAEEYKLTEENNYLNQDSNLDDNYDYQDSDSHDEYEYANDEDDKDLYNPAHSVPQDIRSEFPNTTMMNYQQNQNHYDEDDYDFDYSSNVGRR